MNFVDKNVSMSADYDLGYTQREVKKLIEERLPKMTLWKTGKGYHIPVRNLEDSHLSNILWYCFREWKKLGSVWHRDWFFKMKAEQVRRWKKHPKHPSDAREFPEVFKELLKEE